MPPMRIFTTQLSFDIRKCRLSLFCSLRNIYRNFEFVVFKLPEKQMFGEGPILLSTVKVRRLNIMQQLQTDLIECVTKHGFR